MLVYNGIGPEWLPAFIREKLTKYLAIFAPACLIHDFRFWIGNGSYLDFASANNALEENLYKCVNAEIKWYHPFRRLAGYYAAHLMAEACRRYGWSAYRAGRMDDEAVEVSGSGSDVHSTPTPKNYTSKLSLCLSASVLTLLTGCYRLIELVREGEYTLSYTAVGLKTDVDTIEAEKTTNGVRVLIKGVATDVSERNAKIIESSGSAVGNVAKEVMGGVK